MKTMTSVRRTVCAAAIAALGSGAVGCGIEKQSAPALAGPSEFGTAIAVNVTPDALSRDGESQATVTVTVRDPENRPVPGLSLVLSLTPSHGGVLSAGSVVTGADGRASAVYTAPSLNTPLTSVTVGATPVGNDANNAFTRSASVSLIGPTAATPSFAVSPESPQRFQLATLDGTGTTLNGGACNGDCQYTWRIGSEAVLTGQVVTHRFQQAQTYVVVLEATSPGGVVTQTSRSVTISAATQPTAVFTVSPTSPEVNQTTFFSGAGSTAANDATIAEYTWDLGNGNTASGVSVSTSYGAPGTYVVRLTIRDTNGLTATSSQSVTVQAP